MEKFILARSFQNSSVYLTGSSPTEPVPGLLFASGPFLRYNRAGNTHRIIHRFKLDGVIKIAIAP